MSAVASALLSGFLTCATLIVAIGAQNMFVLRQGLQGSHVGVVVAVCGLADTLLVSLGVGGGGSMLALVPGLSTGLTLGGSLFLLGYGVLALRRATAETAMRLEVPRSAPLGRTLAATAAFTFLNPHVYLDTVLLMGAAGASHPAPARPFFIVGAAAASFAWFGTIGFGARRLAPLFARPATWRLLDGAVGCLMLALACNLLSHLRPFP